MKKLIDINKSKAIAPWINRNTRRKGLFLIRNGVPVFGVPEHVAMQEFRSCGVIPQRIQWASPSNGEDLNQKFALHMSRLQNRVDRINYRRACANAAELAQQPLDGVIDSLRNIFPGPWRIADLVEFAKASYGVKVTTTEVPFTKASGYQSFQIVAHSIGVALESPRVDEAPGRKQMDMFACAA